MTQQLDQATVIHVRFEGRSLDVNLDELGLGLRPDDRELKRVLARHLEIGEGALRDYVVDRHATGNLTVRPEAVFG